MRRDIPTVRIAPPLAEELVRHAAGQSLDDLERLVLRQGVASGSQLQFSAMEAWCHFRRELQQHWLRDDHAVVRGVPPDDEGKLTILLGVALSSRFRPYRGEQIVKQFRMSPWTTDLSQTTKDGHFHTDLNTDASPPCVTIIHCRKPDPSPDHGLVHVARLSDLLEHLRHTQQHETLQLLCGAEVEMVDERSPGSRLGRIVAEGKIQFHPQTLRAAARRGGRVPADLEEHLATIHQSALAVSTPIALERGDALLVSNARALHYRGSSTVRFFDFPRGFESREIFVLHLVDEPQWPT